MKLFKPRDIVVPGDGAAMLDDAIRRIARRAATSCAVP